MPGESKREEINGCTKEKNFTEYWNKCVLPNTVVKVNGQRIYSELR